MIFRRPIWASAWLRVRNGTARKELRRSQWKSVGITSSGFKTFTRCLPPRKWKERRSGGKERGEGIITIHSFFAVDG